LIYPGVLFNSRGFPLHPDQEDCEFYLRTKGECKFGCTCTKNHPEIIIEVSPNVLKNAMPLAIPTKGKGARIFGGLVDQGKHGGKGGSPSPGSGGKGSKGGKGSATSVAPRSYKKEFPPSDRNNSMGLPIRDGVDECPHFLKTLSCKYGATCTFTHPELADAAPTQPSSRKTEFRNLPGVPEPDAYTSKNLPIRYGVETCTFFAKTGDCKFGPTCKWDHGDDTYNPEFGHAETATHGKGGGGSQGRKRRLSKEEEFPEALQVNSMGYSLRPGEQECAFFVKTGTCSFTNTCKFHHPEELCVGGGQVQQGSRPGSAKRARTYGNHPDFPPADMVNSQGFPVRPGQTQCSFFIRTGSCQFANTCKYDHPEGMGGSDADFR